MNIKLKIFIEYLSNYILTKIINSPENRMWRIGGGYNENRWYFQIDLGTRGWRITNTFDWMVPYYREVLSNTNPEIQKALTAQATELRTSNAARITVTRNGRTVSEVKDEFKILYYKGIATIKAHDDLNK